MGMEGAGIVEKVHDDKHQNLVGKWVAFMTWGAWSQYANVKVDSLLEFNDDIDFEDISYALVNPFTVCGMVDISQTDKASAIIVDAAAS